MNTRAKCGSLIPLRRLSLSAAGTRSLDDLGFQSQVAGMYFLILSADDRDALLKARHGGRSPWVALIDYVSEAIGNYSLKVYDRTCLLNVPSHTNSAEALHPRSQVSAVGLLIKLLTSKRNPTRPRSAFRAKVPSSLSRTFPSPPLYPPGSRAASVPCLQ